MHAWKTCLILYERIIQKRKWGTERSRTRHGREVVARRLVGDAGAAARARARGGVALPSTSSLLVDRDRADGILRGLGGRKLPGGSGGGGGGGAAAARGVRLLAAPLDGVAAVIAMPPSARTESLHALPADSGLWRPRGRVLYLGRTDGEEAARRKGRREDGGG